MLTPQLIICFGYTVNLCKFTQRELEKQVNNKSVMKLLFLVKLKWE